jgi:hypothetical protein
LRALVWDVPENVIYLTEPPGTVKAPSAQAAVGAFLSTAFATMPAVKGQPCGPLAPV